MVTCQIKILWGHYLINFVWHIASKHENCFIFIAGKQQGICWSEIKITQIFEISKHINLRSTYFTFQYYAHWLRFIVLCGNLVIMYHYIPRTTKLLGVYWFHSVHPSVRPSVRLSRLPCPLCNIYSSEWILSILATNDHYHEMVCGTQWPLTLTYIFRVIWPWLRMGGFFLYLAQMITIIRGCVPCYVFFRIWQFEFLANF